MLQGHSLAIIGCGHVGSYVLTEAMASGLFAKVVVVDKERSVAYGEALDHHHGTGAPNRRNTTVIDGDYEDCRDIDLAIIAAGPSMLPTEGEERPDRAALAPHNAEVIRQVMGDLSKVAPDAIVIVITNPLDTMAHIAATEFGYPEGRVFGTGTMLDSSRMRRLIADRHNIDPASVQGFMVGEHGLSAVPALSCVSVAGFSNDQLGEAFGGQPYELEELADAVVGAAYEVFNGKGWTNAGIAKSAIELATCVLLDERSVYPVSLPLKGLFGIEDVSLSLPCVIGANGVEARLEPPLNDAEIKKLHASAEAIRDAMRTAKVGKFA